ncbi:MAG: lytic transglycosylase domain-containing protein [Anaerolineae bacterium]
MAQVPIRAVGRGHTRALECGSSRALVAVAAIVVAAALLAGPQVATADPGYEQELAAALSLVRDGFYREAADSLALLLDGQNPADPQVLTVLAESHEGLGDWSTAADDWRRALAATTDAEARATLVFRRAYALQQAEQPLLAARLYRLFLSLRPDSHARGEALLRIADNYVAAGLPSVAARYYRDALADLPASTERVDVLLRLADALLLSGKVTSAVELFAAEAASVPDGDVPRYQYRWGQAERAAGNESGGLERMRTVFLSYPRSPFAHAALVELIDAGQEVDEYLRGLVDYYADTYEPAVAAFGRYVEADPDGHQPAAHYYAGLSLRALKLYPEAIAEFDLLIDGSPEDSTVPDAIIAKAEALVRAGDSSSAASLYVAFVDARGDHAQAPEALYRAGTLLESLGRMDEAEQVYKRLYTAYPAASQAPAGALHAGLAAYRAARWADAEAYLAQAAGLCGDCADANRYRFWQARALLAQQRRDEATTLLTAVAGSAPGDYYSYRAWVLLQGNDPLAQGSGNSLLLPDDTARAAVEDWLRQTADSSWEPGTFAPALLADARFAAAQEWLALGMGDRATNLALDLGGDLRQDAVAEYTLAVWLRDNGLYRPSIQVAANIIYTHADAANTVPAYIWSLVYPTYYSGLVLDEANANGLDPLLFFALMRQESLFDAGIGSHAGAQGLAQVMPATGEWIASMLGDTDFAYTDLLRPCVSVRYGIWYLAQQMAYLDGDPLAALAAYNAGPGNAAKWSETAGGDPDVFYETIAFAETRRYLNTILPNYYHYLRLYGSGS